MNTLVKITAVLLALTLLALPATVTATEEGHEVFVVSPTADSYIINMEYAGLEHHDQIPEHMELRPFFRDSDPEFTVIDAAVGGYPTENIFMTEATDMTFDDVSENSILLNSYEYAPVP